MVTIRTARMSAPPALAERGTATTRRATIHHRQGQVHMHEPATTPHAVLDQSREQIRLVMIAQSRTRSVIGQLRELVVALVEDSNASGLGAHTADTLLGELQAAFPFAVCPHDPSRTRGVDVFEATTGETLYIARCQCGVRVVLEIRAASAPVVLDGAAPLPFQDREVSHG